jgi:hypothetical protein
MAQKWNFKTHEYEPYNLPNGASTFETDMNRVIYCAQCGNPVSFGMCYTSRQIHTIHGFGYAVCPKCYEKEWAEEKAAKEAQSCSEQY